MYHPKHDGSELADMPDPHTTVTSNRDGHRFLLVIASGSCRFDVQGRDTGHLCRPAEPLRICEDAACPRDSAESDKFSGALIGHR